MNDYRYGEARKGVKKIGDHTKVLYHGKNCINTIT